MTIKSKWLAVLPLSALLVGIARPAKAQVEDLATIYAIYETANKVYSGYKQMIAILQSGDPTAEDQILAQLNTIEKAMKGIDSQLQALDNELAQLVYEEKRSFYLDLLRNVQDNEALAKTASQQIQEWEQTGKVDANKLAHAENNSQIAANTLMQKSYYLRPGQKLGDSDIFEYRTTLLPYLYSLTVRLGVVALEQPQFRNFSAYTGEFESHVAWLRQISALLESNISCQKDKMVAAGYYAIYSRCQDLLSGYESGMKSDPSPWNPYVTPWTLGSNADADNAFSYYTFYDHWRVQEMMGEHAVENILPYVISAAMPWSPFQTRQSILLSSIVTIGPLSNIDGKCLDSGTGWLVADCNRLSSTQQWMTGNGVVRPISATNPLSALDDCIEVREWRGGPFRMVYNERCSGSSGEQWFLSNANEIRWGRDLSLCLQSDLILQACNGALNQKWYRTWPHRFQLGGNISPMGVLAAMELEPEEPWNVHDRDVERNRLDR